MSTNQDERLTGTSALPSGVPARRRTAAAFCMGALFVGGAGGYLLRSGTGPSPTTNTVVKTLTAPAYVTSTMARAEVLFDGGHAYYSGPTEFSAGTELTVHFTTAISGGSVVISRLEPAPTWEKLTHDIATANTTADVMPLPYVHNVGARDGEGAVVVDLSNGVYSVWAGPLAGPAGGPSVALAAMLRVTP